MRVSAAASDRSAPCAAAPIIPASGPSSAILTAAPVHRRQRPRRASSLRAGARASARRPPRPRRRSRTRRDRRCWRGLPARRRGAGPPRRRPPPARIALHRQLGHRPADDRPARRAPCRGPSRARAPRPLSLPRDRGPRGERLDAAAVGAVALAGRTILLDHDVAQLRTRRRSTRGRSRRRGSSRRRSRSRWSASPRSRAPRPAPNRNSASAATFASLSMKTGSPSCFAIRSRRGTSEISRLTAWIATPRSWSMVAGIPRPAQTHIGPRVPRLPSSLPRSSTSSSSLRPIDDSFPS